MAGKENHIDKIIRQKFENFAPAPPETVWEQVRDNIGDQPGGNPNGSPSGNPIIMPVIAILTIGLILTVTLFNHNADARIMATRSNDKVPVYYAVAGFSSEKAGGNQEQVQ